MTAESEDLILEYLRILRATHAEPGERLAQIELQMQSIGRRLSALTNHEYRSSDRSNAAADADSVCCHG